MVDDDLTCILPKRYCLISGGRKIRTHHLAKVSFICFPSPRKLLPMSASAMALRA